MRRDGEGGLTRRSWPEWWHWDLEISSHLLKRMIDRRFSEIDLRGMLQRSSRLRRDIVPGRWVAVSRHLRHTWEVILEPDLERQLVVVITAYPLE